MGDIEANELGTAQSAGEADQHKARSLRPAKSLPQTSTSRLISSVVSAADRLADRLMPVV